jgi:6-pyruvoyl-tetrahydropterin synthase
MSRMMTGVGAILCAAHRDVGTGKLHGHTWEITVWFRRGTDATIRACRLDSIIKEIDHSELPNTLAWGEDIAEWVATKFDDSSCLAVDVARPAERIYARWER